MTTPTTKNRSQLMSKIRKRDTKPELLVRRLVHRLGYRYRLHVGELPGSPDLVFPKLKCAIFVHGCFWHQHDHVSCRAGKVRPRVNTDYWGPKLERNVARDAEAQSALEAGGWRVLVLWECELGNGDLLEGQVTAFLGQR